MQLGRHVEATEAFQLAMDADGADTTFLFNLGWSQWRLGKGASALEHLERAAELMPCDGEVHLLLSSAASSQAKFELAERARSTALMLSPHLADVDPATATDLARIKEKPAIVRAPVDLHADREKDVMALAALFDVQALRERGRLDEAIQLLQRSIHRDPGAVDLRLYLELEDPGKALTQVDKALALEPGHDEAKRLRAELEIE